MNDNWEQSFTIVVLLTMSPFLASYFNTAGRDNIIKENYLMSDGKDPNVIDWAILIHVQGLSGKLTFSHFIVFLICLKVSDDYFIYGASDFQQHKYHRSVHILDF